MVQSSLVRQVNTLASGIAGTRDRSMKQALAAFSFITIPSIRDAKTRILLYLESGQVAMISNCLGQAEACFRAINNNILQGYKSAAISDSSYFSRSGTWT